MNQLVRRNSLEPSTLGEAITFSQMLARSTMVPKDFQQRPENILVAIQWGREIGLGPLQALQNIAVINGRPSVWGDAMLALVRGSPSCSYVRESVEGDGDEMEAVCRARRTGDPEDIVGRFSVADAKKAGLWSKTGPWTQYPKRMLQMRARGFALRDAFPDVLRGVISAEEARDTPPDLFTGTTIEATPEPPVKATVAYPPPETAAEAIGDSLPEHSAPPKKNGVDEAKVDAKIKELVEKFADTDTLQAHHRLVTEKEVSKAIAWIRDARPARYKKELEPFINASFERNKPRRDNTFEQAAAGTPTTLAERPAPEPNTEQTFNFDDAVEAAS